MTATRSCRVRARARSPDSITRRSVRVRTATPSHGVLSRDRPETRCLLRRSKRGRRAPLPKRRRRDHVPAFDSDVHHGGLRWIARPRQSHARNAGDDRQWTRRHGLRSEQRVRRSVPAGPRGWPAGRDRIGRQRHHLEHPDDSELGHDEQSRSVNRHCDRRHRLFRNAVEGQSRPHFGQPRQGLRPGRRRSMWARRSAL